MRSLAAAVVAVAVMLSTPAVGPAAGCSSSISKRPSRPSRPGTAAPSAPPPTARANVTFPTYKCAPPYLEFYCLNDAKCFTIIIQDSPLYNCECKDGFVGQRCEYKDLDGSYLLSRGRLMLETASIAGGATVAAFLALLVCFGVWMRARRRGKDDSAPCEDGVRPNTVAGRNPPRLLPT